MSENLGDKSRRISQIEQKASTDCGSINMVSKILIVDDERFNCDIIESFLMVLGFPNYL